MSNSPSLAFVSMLKILAATPLLAFSCSCLAGELVRDTTIIEVANTYFGADFAVKISGGSGVCAGAAWIVFPEAKARSAASNKQAIATALLAFSTTKKVRIHNYDDDSCLSASFISISN